MSLHVCCPHVFVHMYTHKHISTCHRGAEPTLYFFWLQSWQAFAMQHAVVRRISNEGLGTWREPLTDFAWLCLCDVSLLYTFVGCNIFFFVTPSTEVHAQLSVRAWTHVFLPARWFCESTLDVGTSVGFLGTEAGIAGPRVPAWTPKADRMLFGWKLSKLSAPYSPTRKRILKLCFSICSNKCIASRNKCLTSSNKKLLVLLELKLTCHICLDGLVAVRALQMPEHLRLLAQPKRQSLRWKRRGEVH